VRAYVAGGQDELVVVERDGLRGDVHAEEAAGVPEGELEGGVERGHLRGHQRRVRPGLHHELVERDALQHSFVHSEGRSVGQSSQRKDESCRAKSWIDDG
jgi:hypothetical protein